MELAGDARIGVDGAQLACDILRIRVTPGLGLSAGDELALYIDREARRMRRVRLTLSGLASTQGAVAEVDAGAHVRCRECRCRRAPRSGWCARCR